MTTAIQRRRGTTSEHTTFTGLLGEVTVDTDKDTLVVHDGSTAGGFPLLREDLSNNTNVLTTTNTKTLSNKSISLGSNTLTGTIAQFNSALTDSDFVDTTSTQTIAGTKTLSSSPILSAGTANGVLYLNGSKVATSGSALYFDGTNLGVGTTSPTSYVGKVVVNGHQSILGGNGLFLWDSTNANAPSIYAPGDSFAFKNNAGSELMRLTSTGLGIGTSSPAYKLDLSTSYDGRGRVWFAALAFVGNNDNGTGYQLRTPTSTSDGLVFSNGGNSAEWARFDSSGNLGLGVTPSAWISSGKAIDIAGFGSVAQTSSGSLASTFNAYQNSAGNWIYKTTNAAAQYQCGLAGLGQHAWFTAPSGTAGATATLTQAMTLSASGNLLVGLTSPSLSSRLEVKSSNNALAGFTGGDASGTSYFVNTNGSGQVNHYATWATSGVNAYHAWWVTASSGVQTQAMTLDASGNLLLGTTSLGGRLTVDSGSTGLMGTFNSTHANGGYLELRSSGTVYGDIGTAAQLVGGGSASDFAINGRGSRNLVFGTNNAERARIDSSGRMGLGTTSPDSNYYLTVGITSSDTYAAARFNRGTTSSTTSIAFANPNGVVGTVSTSGTSTAYNTSSDYRLKENIQPMTGALAFVRKQRPVTYNWKADGSEGAGYIAHWMQEDGAGNCVTGTKDAVDAEGKPVYQGIDTSFMVAPLNAAINELAEIVEAQAAIIEQLKADVAALKGA